MLLCGLFWVPFVLGVTRSLKKIRDATHDVAHEHCSPIARMQMAIGFLEQRTSEEQRPRVEDVRDELQHAVGLGSD
jgi:signal transduction histidine kinase